MRRKILVEPHNVQPPMSSNAGDSKEEKKQRESGPKSFALLLKLFCITQNTVARENSRTSSTHTIYKYMYPVLGTSS